MYTCLIKWTWRSRGWWFKCQRVDRRAVRSANTQQVAFFILLQLVAQSHILTKDNHTRVFSLFTLMQGGHFHKQSLSLTSSTIIYLSVLWSSLCSTQTRTRLVLQLLLISTFQINFKSLKEVKKGSKGVESLKTIRIYVYAIALRRKELSFNHSVKSPSLSLPPESQWITLKIGIRQTLTSVKMSELVWTAVWSRSSDPVNMSSHLYTHNRLNDSSR